MFYVIVLTYNAIGQDNRPSEAELKIEEMFIEATQKKILGFEDDALALFVDLLKKDPENAEVAYQISRLKQQSNSITEAIQYAQIAFELKQGIVYQDHYIQLLKQSGDDQTAFDLYESLLKNEPSNKEYLYEFAFLNDKVGKTDQAIKMLNTLQKQSGLNEKISFLKYNLYLKLNKSKKAVQELMALSEVFPENAEYMIQVAQHYNSDGDESAAKVWYDKALKKDPMNVMANIALLKDHLENNNIEGYFKSAKVILISPQTPLQNKTALFKEIIAQLFSGKIQIEEEELFDLLSALKQMYPNDTVLNGLMGEVYFNYGRFNKAKNNYLRRLNDHKSNLLLWTRILDCLIHLDYQRDFIAYANEFYELFPANASAYLYKGIAKFYEGDINLANQKLKEANLVSSNDPSVLMWYPLFSLKCADEKKVESIMQIMEQDPTSKNNGYYQATQLDFLMKVNSAERKSLEKELYDRLTTLTTDHLYVHEILARYLFKQNKVKACLDKLQENIDIKLANSAMLELYGDCLFKQEKLKEALTYWKEAQKLSVYDPLLDQKIREKKYHE